MAEEANVDVQIWSLELRNVWKGSFQKKKKKLLGQGASGLSSERH